VEDGIRNLLDRIGQPAFSYRNFDKSDHSELLARWPLMALIAEQPEMRGAVSGRVSAKPARGTGSNLVAQISQPASASRPGFLGNYGPTSTRRAGEPDKDVRSLLARLSEELR
jgi:hypothetical protein